MSFCHVRLEKVIQSSEVIEYEIHSQDLQPGKSVNLGTVRINRSSGRFFHLYDYQWRRWQIYPLHMFDYDRDSRAFFMDAEWKKCAHGLLVLRIYREIQNLIREKKWPGNVFILG